MKDKVNQSEEEKKLFDEISINCKPAIVLVKAEWSGGSHIMDLILNKIEEKFQNQINVIRIDLETHKELLRSFGIESVPALLLISKGQIVEVIKETLSQKTLQQVIQDLIYKSDSLEEKLSTNCRNNKYNY